MEGGEEEGGGAVVYLAWPVLITADPPSSLGPPHPLPLIPSPPPLPLFPSASLLSLFPPPVALATVSTKLFHSLTPKRAQSSFHTALFALTRLDLILQLFYLLALADDAGNRGKNTFSLTFFPPAFGPVSKRLVPLTPSR